jgi:acid phosphatase type 7
VLAALVAFGLGAEAPAATSSGYAASVLADGPTGYWRLGETAGTVAADASTNASNGTYQNGVTLGIEGALAGDPDRAARFDGSNDRVLVGDPASGVLDVGSADFTLEAWIATTSATGTIAGKKDSGNGGSWWYVTISGDAGHVGQLKATIKDGKATRTAYSLGRVDDGAWHHVAVRVDRDVGVSFFVDGVASGSTSVATPGSLSNAAAFAIGSVGGAPTFRGDIDEVALYRSLLAQDRIQAHIAEAAIDTTAPVVTLTTPANGSSGSDTTPTLGGVAGTERGDTGSVTVKLYDGAGTGGPVVQTLTTTRGSGGAYSVDASPELALGTYTAQAEQGDAAGNTGLSSANTFTVAPPAAGDPILIGAGDIASCGDSEFTGHEETAALLDLFPTATVFTAGDNVYVSGTSTEFRDCYDPNWGRSKDRTRPATGNHDYDTAGAAGYFNYFGASAGDPTKGYYSYDLGDWHIISLNSQCNNIDGCAAGSAQEQWLRADLLAHQNVCTLAYWHYPRFNSGKVHGESFAPYVLPLWNALYENGADVIVSAHEHLYERFLPQRPDRTLDLQYGIAQFTVGTGGFYFYDWGQIRANSAARNNTSYGVIKFTLHPTSYDFEFVPIAGQTYNDSGSASCHGAPGAGPDTTPPSISLTSPADGSTTTDTTPNFAGMAGIAPGDSTTVTVKVYSGTGTGGALVQTRTVTRAGNGTYSVDAAPELPLGTYTAQAEQLDSAANMGFSGANTFTIEAGPPPPPDTTPPVITVDYPHEDTFTSDTTPTISGAAGTLAGDSTTVTLKLYSGNGTAGPLVQTLNTTRAASGAWSVDASPALALGTYTAQAQQSDQAGNVGVSNTTFFTIIEPPPAPPYATEVLSDSPRGYWRLGESSGTNAADQTGTNPGTYQFGVVLGAPGALFGDANTAGRFDGSDDKVSMGDPANGSLDFGTGDFTVEAWVKTTVNGEQAVVSKRATTAGTPLWQFTVTNDPGHDGEIRVNIVAGTTLEVYGPAKRVDDGTWHHVVVVFDRDAGLTIYVDGVSVFRPGAATADVSNAGPFLVAKSTGYNHFKGDLDEVAVYPSALSPVRVQAHYAAGRG